MKKIKILSIYRDYLTTNSGTSIRIRSILEYLDKYKNLDITVCSFDKKYNNFKHIHLSNNFLNDNYKLIKYIKESNINIIIVHTINSYCYLIPIKLFTNIKIILEMHGFMEDAYLIYTRKYNIKYLFYKFISIITYYSCDIITTCSETAKKRLSKYNKNIVTVYGGVDLKLFNPQIKSGRYIKKDKKIVIAYVGNDRLWQGLNWFIDFYNDFSQKYQDFRLVVISSGKHKPDYYRNIEYLKPLLHEEVARLLIDCDILIIPRLQNKVNYFSFPSKLPEYLAMGKVVVASNTSDVNKVIINNFNGVIYEPGNKFILEKTLLYLKDKKLRKKLGGESFNTAKNMTWKKQIDIFYKSLNSLIK